MSAQISLNVDVNPDYKPNLEEDLVIDHADLSELGLRRRRTPANLHVPLVERALFDFPTSGRDKIFTTLLNLPNEVVPQTTIRMSVTTTKIGQYYLGGSKDEQGRVILNLQAALDPLTSANINDVIASNHVNDAVEKLRNQLAASCDIVANHLNTLVHSDDRLRAFATSNDLIANPEVTNIDDLFVRAKALADASYGTMVSLENLLTEVPEAAQVALGKITCLALIASAPREEYAYEHPMIKPFFEEAKRELMTRRLKLPRQVVQHFSKNDHSDIVESTFTYSNDNGQTWLNLEAKAARKDVAAEFAFFVLSFCQIRTTSVERSTEFAFTRMLGLRYGLFSDSEEVAKMGIETVQVVTKDASSTFLDNYRRLEKYYILMYASAISFLKSGHHASAANLDNTVMKMLQAISIPCTLDSARSMIATGVYAGPHANSMRLMLAYLLHRNSEQKVSNSIAYRLAPNPPMSAAYCNLELFCEALNSAGFFYALDRVAEFAEFKRNMREIRATMWYVAPYSMYLYNKSVADPLEVKASAAKLASYAAGITHALPSSSLIISPALRKLSDAQKSNSIAGPLFVQAYSAAFTRWARMTIENALKKKYGARASLLE